nr:LOW QUALITY PROTEIN: putative RRN3-like protein RRN3P2 [Pan troglodytes]
MLGASRTGISNMHALENDFFNSPPRKTVQFGGTVTEVLLKYKKSETNDFELLKNQLLDPDIKDDQIINWLLEFRSSIMYLAKDFEQLISIILRLPWLNTSQTVVEEYLAFLGNLVSAQTVFLRPCLSMIASHFVPPRVIIKEGDVDVSDSDDEDDNIPANFDTSQSLANNSKICTIECYVHNLLRISVYFPTLRHEILELIIEKLLKLDVNASRQGIEDAEETAYQTCGGTDSMEGLFNMGFAEAFLEHLWKKLQDPSNPAIIRQAAGNYIGSFLARAKFIPLITVKSCLDLLVNWLHIYLNNQDSGTKAFCDVALHGPFYSACQAVFYTFVFRHKQLLSGNLKEGLQYLQSLNFERIVMSQLNPLKICLPSVVNFLAAITNKYQLVFCYTIIERNNHQMLPVIRSTTGGDSVQTCTNPLDTFFPFDPCVLKRSKKFIDPIYQVWEDMSAEELQEFKKPMKKASCDDQFPVRVKSL